MKGRHGFFALRRGGRRADGSAATGGTKRSSDGKGRHPDPVSDGPAGTGHRRYSPGQYYLRRRRKQA